MYRLSSTRQFSLSVRRSARVLYQSQRCPGHWTPTGENGGLNQRWQPRFQTKPLGMNLIRSYGTIPNSEVVDEAIARKLASQGDARDVDEIPDVEFNEMFLDAFPKVMIDEDPNHKLLKPRIYNPQSSSWEPYSNQDTAHKKGDLLKIVSWKLFPSTLSLAAIRASAAIDHLRNMFGQKPDNFVVMLQEIRQESLDAILNNKWAQQNFILSDTEAPYSEYDLDDDGESGLESSQCFSIMMVSRNLPISNCSRVSLFSETNCDALVVDVPVSESEGHDPEVSKQSLRLCTTRIEPNYSNPDLRRSQLVTVSELLNGKWSQGQQILGGLVGGNMGPLAVSERNFHRDPEIDLMSNWRNKKGPAPSTLKRSYYRERSNARADAWLFHPDRKRYERKLDKFLYTGSIETFTLDETEDKLGYFGRFWKIQAGPEEVCVSEHGGVMVGIKVK
ncbi:hypothetical protein FSHL1_006741 [Fusarium sambucinum]